MSHPTISVQPIDLSHPGHQAALIMLLDDYARDPMGGGEALGQEAIEHLCERLAQRTDYFGFIAWSDQQAIGLINCIEGFSTFAARPLLNVHDLTVRREWRGHGVGRLLLQTAEALACSRGCCKLTLEVLSNNVAALKAYEQAGFEAYQLDPAAGQALFMHKWLRT